MRFLYIFLLISFNSFAQIVVNEYSAANYNQSQDNYGDYEDWFELYNTDNTAIDLNGYYLSDKSNNLTKFLINSSVTINPNSHQIVYASGRDEIDNGSIHTNFKLHQTKGNEWIILTAPDGTTIIDSIHVKPCQTNHSRGLTTDGDSQWAVFTNPSPNTSNSGSSLAYAQKPSFSLEPGNYSGTANLSISTDDNSSSIYYTTDGSTPDENSQLYTTPINLTNTTVVKAIAINNDEAILNSFIEFGTYFIDDTYSVPVISIAGDEVDDLLNGFQLEPVGTFELFKDGVLVDNAVGDYNKHGNDSWAYPQRGFDYITRDQFGYNYAIQDEVFRTKDRDKYQRLIIKAAANDNYPFSYQASGAHIRDAYVQSLSQISDLRMDERSYEPCILFLNGEYWGLYEIREKVDDLDFTDYYYGQGSGNVDFLKTWGGTWIEYGTDTGWVNIRNYILSNDMSVDANYNHAKSFYNTGSLIDYFILNSYVVNADWLNWNTAWWRGTNPEGNKKKWRYILWDMDNTFDHGANYTGIPSSSPDADPCDPEGLGDTGGQGHVPIWNALLDNEEFFADYINRWTELSNNYFSCEHLLFHFDSLISIIEPEMPAQIDRWGGTYNAWQTNVLDMRDFIENRCEVINSGILDCYEDEYGIEGPYEVTIIVEPPLSGEVEINNYEIDSYPFTGEYFGGITQSLQASAGQDFVFSHWEFSNSTIPNNEMSEIEYELHSNNTIIAHFVPNTTLTINSNPSNTGSITINNINYTNLPTSMHISGEIDVEATPNEGYVFDSWILTSGDIDDSTTSSTSIQITEDATLTANFVLAEFEVLFQINNENGGTISINDTVLANLPESYTFTYNEEYTIGINLNEDFIFNNWEVQNENQFNSTEESFSISLQQSDTITAFVEELFDLSLKVEPEGSGKVLGNGQEMLFLPYTQKFREHTTIQLQAIPSTGMQFDFWAKDNAIIERNNDYIYTIEHDDTLRVVFSEKDLALFIPNSFSPNGDNINDVFKPIGDSEKVKEYQLMIFNEWGEFIFESNDFDIGWAAENINITPNNVFIYKISVTSALTNARFEYKGTVIVL